MHMSTVIRDSIYLVWYFASSLSVFYFLSLELYHMLDGDLITLVYHLVRDLSMYYM